MQREHEQLLPLLPHQLQLSGNCGLKSQQQLLTEIKYLLCIRSQRDKNASHKVVIKFCT